MSQNNDSIDIHSHVLPSELLPEFNAEVSQAEELYNLKIRSKNIGPVTKGFFDAPARRKELKDLGIGSQVVSVTHHLFMYNEDVTVAKQFARRQNEAISALCKSNSDVFAGNGTLPLQDVQLSLEEVDYIYSKLGLKGVEIGTNIAGKNLDSPEFFPMYEKLQELKMPVFVHPNDVLGADRMKKYYMEIVLGTLAETTVAITSLIFGGVIKRFPNLKFIFCHGGGAIPYQIGRLERAVKVRKELRDNSISAYESYRKLYFDIVLFRPEQLEWLIKSAGSERVVFGTDYPFNMGDWKALDVLQEADVDANSKSQIAAGNARQLYGL